MEATTYIINNNSKGGRLDPETIDPKSGLQVKKVLEQKHPQSLEPSSEAIVDYENTP